MCFLEQITDLNNSLRFADTGSETASSRYYPAKSRTNLLALKKIYGLGCADLPLRLAPDYQVIQRSPKQYRVEAARQRTPCATNRRANILLEVRFREGVNVLLPSCLCLPECPNNRRILRESSKSIKKDSNKQANSPSGCYPPSTPKNRLSPLPFRNSP